MTIDADVGSLSEPFSGRRWDRPEIRRQTELRMRAYSSQGFIPGDRVLILFGNRLEFFAELLAIWRLGGCVIPVNPNLTPFETGKLAEVAAARFCVGDDGTKPENIAAVPGAIFMHTLRHEPGKPDPDSPDACPRLDDDALIIFTSGSTGQPKGVVMTLRSILSRLLTMHQCFGIEDFRRSLFVLPTHAAPLITNCLFPWLSGCDVFIAPPFNASTLMNLGKLIDENQISFMMSVPSMWNLVLKAANPPKNRSLQRLHLTSSPLPREQWEEIQRWSGIRTVVNAYGSTETVSSIAALLDRDIVPETDLIGPPLGCRFRIASSAPGEPGMLWVATAALMRGYLDRQDLTDAVVKQGWYMTGDIGLVDERGWLFLKGRERDEINRGGIKIFPTDIDHVARQFRATSDVCTFRIPDELYGENIGIALVLTDEGVDSLGELYRWMESRLARHKMPARWYVLDSLPRTNRGKINRETIMRLCESRKPADLSAALRKSG